MTQPKPRSRTRLLRVVTALVLLLALPAEAAPAKKRPVRRAAPVDLVWHVETLDGVEVTSNLSDLPINPASVVKVATTLWALEKLGPDHRFDTAFTSAGSIDPKLGQLNGELLVRGAGDPDFQVENAFLVAARLNQIGVRVVRGALRVSDTFWIGWEGGSERMLKDPAARSSQMAQRLRAALDPRRWNPGTRAAWRQFALRYSLPVAAPPGVTILGGTGAAPNSTAAETVLVTHRSKTLVETLRRFDCYSNNDIERLGASLGSPAELSSRLAELLQVPPQNVQLQTISGLGTNRMTPRVVVQLLRALRATCTRLGLSVESVLPVAGCDPGTLTHSFARLGNGPNSMSVVAKTGTLTSTDGGTAALAGFASTGKGEMVFCVVAPGAAGRLHLARSTQAQWVEKLIAAADGPRPRTCAGPLASPEEDAQILLGSEASLSPTAGIRVPPAALDR